MIVLVQEYCTISNPSRPNFAPWIPLSWRLSCALNLKEIGRLGIGTKCVLYEQTDVSISSEPKKKVVLQVRTMKNNFSECLQSEGILSAL